MSAKPPPLSKPTRYPRRILFLTAAVGLALLAIPVVWHLNFRIRTAERIRTLEAKARANGEPITVAELKATIYGPIPDEENAALVLMETWSQQDPELWESFREGRYRLPEPVGRSIPDNLPVFSTGWLPASRTNPLSPDTVPLVNEFLEQNASLLTGLHLSVRREKARFPLRFEDGLQTQLPHLSKLKFSCQALRLEALHALTIGDVGKAIRSAEAGFALTEFLRDEPVVISQLMRVACQRIAGQTVEDILNHQKLALDDLNRLSKAVIRTADDNLIWRGLLGERVLSGLLFDHPEQLNSLSSEPGELADSSKNPGGDSFMTWRLLGYAKADKALFLETLDEMLHRSKEGFPESLTSYPALFTRFDTKQGLKLDELFSRTLLMALSKAIHRQATADAHRHMVETAIAIERFRLDHSDAVPQALEELVPRYLASLPQDPFDGQPLGYSPKDSGYELYSVGADRVDDGGVTQAEAKANRSRSQTGSSDRKAPTFDECFRVAR